MSAASPPWPLGVLLTNDDGPPSKYSPYLLPFSRSLKRRFAVLHAQAASPCPSPTSIFVCTPSDQQSWVGKAVSRFTQVRAHSNWSTAHLPASSSPPSPSPPPTSFVTSPSLDVELWSSVDGTPSTTANVGLHVLAPFPIDLVLSGPNLGRNTGRSFILSSGTVGAALEGAFGGRKAIALSFAFFDRLSAYTEQHVADACEAAVDVVEALWMEWPAGVELFNVNVPLGCARDVRVLHTHVLIDCYGSIYTPSAHRTLSPPPPSPPHVDPRAQEPLSSPLPLPSSSTLPHPRPSLLLNGAVPSPVPTQPIPIVGTSAAPLSNSVDFRFNVEMFHTDWSGLPGYVGSDYWAVKNGMVSVTPLTGSIAEVPWTSTRFQRSTDKEEAIGDMKSAL